MSSDFYSACLSRNLVRSGGLEYRENAAIPLLYNAIEADGCHDLSVANFTSFPDFDRKRKTSIFGYGRVIRLTTFQRQTTSLS